MKWNQSYGNKTDESIQGPNVASSWVHKCVTFVFQIRSYGGCRIKCVLHMVFFVL
jgi:hypothetical protein